MFTKREQHTISKAFQAIQNDLEERNPSLPYEWREAFKTEKRQCRSHIAAKALMVECFFEGVTKTKPTSELIRIRTGCRTAHLIGAHVSTQREGLAVGILKLCEESNVIKNRNMTRELDQIAKS